jgi:hypothetical protein
VIVVLFSDIRLIKGEAGLTVVYKSFTMFGHHLVDLCAKNSLQILIDAHDKVKEENMVYSYVLPHW